jgi:hypothetical protein
VTVPDDPANDAPGIGCGPAGQRAPTQPDDATPNVLWDTTYGATAETTNLLRSPDGGATWRPWVSMASRTAYQLAVSTPPGRTPLAVGFGGTGYLGWSVGGAPFRPAPAIRLRSEEKGSIAEVGLVPGTDLVLAAYVDGKGAARLFTYDARHGRDWVERQRPPSKNKGKTPAWDVYSTVRFVADARSPYVYLWLWNGFGLYRFDTRGGR